MSQTTQELYVLMAPLLFVLMLIVFLVVVNHISTYHVFREHTKYWYWIRFFYAKAFQQKYVVKFEHRILHDDPALTETDNYGSDKNKLDVYGRRRSGIYLSDLSPDTKAFLKSRGIKCFYTRHIFVFQEPRLHFADKQGYTVWLLAKS